MHPLAVDLRADLAGVLREARLLADARTRFSDAACSTDETLRWLTVGGIASGIEKTYSGMERLLRRIAAEIDRHVPRDEAWHATLLRRMASPLPGTRKAVLSTESHAQLDALRAFRHRERHSYATDLEPARVLAMAEAVAPAVTMFATELERFLAMLEQEPPAFP